MTYKSKGGSPNAIPIDRGTTKDCGRPERLIFMEQDVVERNNGIRIEKYLSILTE